MGTGAAADRTFAAVVARSAVAAPVIGQLEAFGVEVCVVCPSTERAAAPGTSRSFAAPESAAAWLAGRGITGELIALLGEDFSATGADAIFFVPQLERAARITAADGGRQFTAEQIARCSARRVPGIDRDPEWILPLRGTSSRVTESLGVLSNGAAAVRATFDESPGSTPALFVQGVYDGSEDARLVPGPVWMSIDDAGADSSEWILDLRTGVVAHRSTRAAARGLHFVSAQRERALAMRYERTGPIAPIELRAPTLGAGPQLSFEHSVAGDGTAVATVASPRGGAIGLAVRERRGDHSAVVAVERVATFAARRRPADGDPGEPAREQSGELEHVKFEVLLAEHRRRWAESWRGAAVSIDGDPDAQLAARFAVFHLLSCARGDGEIAVGARGLTGPAYGGHVFWDTDVFVLPALAAVNPPAARAVVEYRIRRLPAARAAASAQRRGGARFPWESAGDGGDVTPRVGVNRHGELVDILTGPCEEHITADVAWSACEYVAWTGDEALLAGPGADLVLDTARYWASRCDVDDDGRAHVRGVIGPDEYHAIVDDNAFTNVMARWNLRRAVALARATGRDDEATIWARTAHALVDGYDPTTGWYEQFAGYWQLEPLLAAEIGGPMVAADLILGATRTAASQIIKQADVLMLHHMVPDEVAAGSLVPNLDRYLPRTAHGSSLSPAIHAALLARAGRPDAALDLFRLAARLDLDDLTGTTAGGLHLATMGGLWQALAYGFLGTRPRGAVLQVDPRLPAEWRSLEMNLCFRGAIVSLRADHHTLTVTADVATDLFVGGRRRRVGPGRTLIEIGARP